MSEYTTELSTEPYSDDTADVATIDAAFYPTFEDSYAPTFISTDDEA